MPKAEEMIREGVAPLLEPGEEVLAGVVVAPRGHTQSVAGVEALGKRQTDRVVGAGGEAGFIIESPMGLALTSKRLLGLRVSNPVGMGIGGKVKEVLSEVPLAEIDAIESKRLLLGSTLTLTIRGVPMKLEAGAGAKTKDLANAFKRVKGV